MLDSLQNGYKACIIGASGAIGSAYVAALEADPRCARVIGLHRHSEPAIDFADEASVAAAARALAEQGPFDLIIHSAGVLHNAAFMPEKKLGDLHYAQMQQTFLVNTFGPALVLQHFSKLLTRERGIFAMLSAKVGSIGDNRAGGWYSYRASKAALNMLVKTAAIELKRSLPHSVLVALHPGTVQSPLSQPFRGGEAGRLPTVVVCDMLQTLNQLQSSDSGSFVAYNGERLPW